MQAAIGALILLIILSFLSIKEIFSNNNQNGVQVESPIYYLLTTSVMTLVPVVINPAGSDPRLYVLILLTALFITGLTYYRLPKITLYQVDWLLAVSTVRKVLDHLGYEYEEVVKQKGITETHVYQFRINTGKNARIEIVWPKDDEDDAVERDLNIQFYKRNKIDQAGYLHAEVIKALRVRREGQRSTKQTFTKSLMSVFTIAIPVIFLFFILT
jgi:hypothetical protein